MNFSVVYWNLQLDNQLEGKRGAGKLFNALDRLIEEYHPDCFGLNEVLKACDKGKMPFVLEYLKKKGYTHIYYANSGKWTDKWDIGEGIVSRYPLISPKEVVLGGHFSKGSHLHDSEAKAIITGVKLKNSITPKLVVAHLMHLRPHTLPTHFQHQKNLTNYVAKLPASDFVIAGGDFNEFKIMPLSFARRNKGKLHAKTGYFKEMTWHKKARKSAILRANPDRIFWSKNPGLKLKEFKVIPIYASDHKPLYAKFSIE